MIFTSSTDSTDSIATALDLGNQNRYAEAVSILRHSSKHESNDAHRLVLLASYLLEISEFEEAYGRAKRVIEVLPDQSHGYELAAKACLGLGLRREALSLAQVAVRCAPHKPEAHMIVADCFAALKMKRESRLVAARAKELRKAQAS